MRLSSIILIAGFCIIFSGSALADPDDDRVFKAGNPDLFDSLLDSLLDHKRKRTGKQKEKHERDSYKDESKLVDDSKRTFLKEIWLDDFKDTDFGKYTFADLRDLDGMSLLAGDWRKKKDNDNDIEKEYDYSRRDSSDRDLSESFKLYERKEKLEDARVFNRLDKLTPGIFHDWVPSDPDPTANGAFSTPPDNGFPVPYTLNGWVDIQRKLPWEAEP